MRRRSKKWYKTKTEKNTVETDEDYRGCGPETLKSGLGCVLVWLQIWIYFRHLNRHFADSLNADGPWPTIALLLRWAVALCLFVAHVELEPVSVMHQTVDVPAYSDLEYHQHLHDDNWSKQETDRLFELCRRFDLRFIVIHDRWDHSQSKRSVEDLKERYYNICAILAKVVCWYVFQICTICFC